MRLVRSHHRSVSAMNLSGVRRSPVDMGALDEELIKTAVAVNATEEAHSEAAGRIDLHKQQQQSYESP